MTRRKTLPLLFLLAASFAVQVSAIYNPVREYKGDSFFDGWNYYDNVDDTTWGNVTYLDRENAMSRRLTYVNPAGNAVMRVDNTTYIAPAPQVNRASIKIISQDTYGAGSLIVLDVDHIPYGCSVWPAFWTKGVGQWPYGGEVDIIEGINLMGRNQYALHTTEGCNGTMNSSQTGHVQSTDCSTPSGCVVTESEPNSYGAGFAQAGGGVYATQLDVSGIYIWFWTRNNVPDNIKSATSQSTLDTTSWGPPSAAYPSTTCNYSQYFAAQQLIFTTTLCGVWAGVPGIYSKTCHTPKNSCVEDNVIGPGHPTYDNAYWEIKYLRTYAAEDSN